MRECLISDGTRTVRLTLWGDLVELVKENHLIQICNASSRIYFEELVITTNYSTSICYLTEQLEVAFDEMESLNDDSSGNDCVCCPRVESVRIDSFLCCKVCSKKLTITPRCWTMPL